MAVVSWGVFGHERSHADLDALLPLERAVGWTDWKDGVGQ